MKNFTVVAKLEIRAENEEDAELRIRKILEKGYRRGCGLSPVAELTVLEGAPSLLDKLHGQEPLDPLDKTHR